MATIKSYTDFEQSKKLAEILPLESADMLFQLGEDKYASKNYDNPIDACYDMILMLHKQNLL